MATIAALNLLSPVFDPVRAATVTGIMPPAAATLLPMAGLTLVGVAFVAVRLRGGLPVGA